MVLTTVREAMQDPMTGLYNRRGMYSAARRLAPARTSVIVVAAVIDLDGFKDLNDTHGHEHGDSVLRDVADVLHSCVRAGDVVARTGGDEFVVVAALGSPSAVDGFISRLRSALYSAADTVTASVGIAWCYSHDGCDNPTLDEVLRLADTAMYESKRTGGNRISFSERVPG